MDSGIEDHSAHADPRCQFAWTPTVSMAGPGIGDSVHWAAAALEHSHGETNGIPVAHTRDNRKLAAAAAADQLHPDDMTSCSPCGHRRSNRCSEVAAGWRYPAVVDPMPLETTNVGP